MSITCQSKKKDVIGSCAINDLGISQLNLVELGALNNPNITDVNHMSK